MYYYSGQGSVIDTVYRLCFNVIGDVLHLCAAGYVNITIAVLLKLPVLVFCLTVLVVDFFYFFFLRKFLRYVCMFADFG